ncbi:TH1 protein [Gongronella butleri]|nr:TH1 protein [Gongronella butleri]
MSAQGSSLQDHRNALSEKDAILEPEIYSNVLAKYLSEGGQPLDAVTLLAESYVGVPSMCNVLSSAGRAIDVDTDQVFRNTVRTMLKDKFDPARCDPLVEEMLNNEHMPSWLTDLIQDAYWRQSIYELLEAHPQSTFLNYVVLQIAESEYSEEMAQLKTASTYLQVYNKILDAALSKLVPVDDLEFEHQLPNIVRVYCEREETYFYAQALLHKLCEKPDNLPLVRLSKELEKVAMRSGQHAFVHALKQCSSDAPAQVAGAIKAVASNPTPGDIMTLYNLYTSPQPPATHHLCDYDLIASMIRTTFVPKSGIVLKPEINDKLLYLLAYATTRNDTKPLQDQQDQITRVHVMLKTLCERLKDAKGEGLTGAIKTILDAIKLPIGAMCVLHWIEYTSIHTPYFETYFRSSEVPVLHLLLDEIAFQHPLQRSFVFGVIKTCLLRSYENFAPEILMRLQKAWIDRLVYLVQLHYSMPVLRFMKQVERDVDDSLTVHFVQNVLRMARGPYTLPFVEHMVALLLPIKETLGLLKPVQLAVVSFLEQAQQQSDIIITDELEAKIHAIYQARHARQPNQ